MDSDTLARRLGTTAHVSPLLAKARKLGLRAAADLEKLAIQRGCRYYDLHGVVREEPLIQVDRKDFSNAELAVALLALYQPVSLLRQRMGAAMLSAPDVNVHHLAALAIEEQCPGIVHYIARCASSVEPEKTEWKQLQVLLASYSCSPEGMPHPTRFIEMTGITRGKVGIVKHWVRPVEALALS